MSPHLTSFARDTRSLALFAVLLLVFRGALADWNDVPSGSMRPTIVEGDRILVDKLAYDLRVPLTHISLYRFANPARGDIIVFDSAAAGMLLVKRVMGVPGDLIEMRDNRLFVNGEAARYTGEKPGPEGVLAIETVAGVSHRVAFDPAGGPLSSFAPVRVPEGGYLVLGDNRDNSADSRVRGFVPRDEILGRSRTVVMSLDHDHWLLPRGDRFLKGL